MTRASSAESGFATKEFLSFASKDMNGCKASGIMQLDGIDPFPYLIVSAKNAFFHEDRNFIVSPICFSGASHVNFDTLVEQLLVELNSFDLAGGFLQTRDARDLPLGMQVLSPSTIAHVDTRTNYRLSLGLPLDDLIKNMKRDSRARVRKLMAREDEMTIRCCDQPSESDIHTFAAMYEMTANHAGFSQHYRFTIDHWSRLFSSDKWLLFLLSTSDTPVAGAAVTHVNGGFDYTFMGANPEVRDAGRAIIVHVYKHLSEHFQGTFDLGGGITEGDNLAKFKISMGGALCNFRRTRFIHAPDISLDATEGYLEGRWP